jgi:hypothetical protein
MGRNHEQMTGWVGLGWGKKKKTGTNLWCQDHNDKTLGAADS